MAKTGKISLSEKQFVIDNYKKISIDNIAKGINRTTKVVESIIHEFSLDEEVQTNRDTGVVKTRQTTGIVHKDGTTIMTREASEKSDYIKHKPGSGLNRKVSDAVAKSYPDE